VIVDIRNVEDHPEGMIAQITPSDQVSVGMTQMAVRTYEAAVDDLGRFFGRS
jgi:hypothetical protein